MSDELHRHTYFSLRQVINMKINRKEPIYLLILLQFVRMLNMGGYTKYLIPLGLSMLFVIYGKDTIKRNNAFILVPGFTYVFFGLMSSFISGFLDSSSIKTGILLTISSVSVLFLYEKIIDHEIDICRVLFLAFAIYTATFFTISFTSLKPSLSLCYLFFDKR